MTTSRRPPPTDPSARDLREALGTARRELTGVPIDREEEVDLTRTAVVDGEHLLMRCRPGSGKSMPLNSLLARTRFSLFLTKLTTPKRSWAGQSGHPTHLPTSAAPTPAPRG